MTDFKKKILGSLLFFITALFVLIVLFLFPLFKDIQSASQELLLIREEVIAITKRNREISLWKKSYPDLGPDLQKALMLFINPEIPVDFVKFLEKTIEEDMVSGEISLLSTKEGNYPFDSLRFKVSLMGTFPSYLKTLDKLENAPYLIEIESLTCSKLNRLSTEIRGQEFSSDKNIKVDLLIKVLAVNETGY